MFFEPIISNSNNKNLHKAKKAKNDEFYTMLSDIEKELVHYKNHFKDKIIYCNCDDPRFSNFWNYFHLNFEHLGLKKLISTHYNIGCGTFKAVYCGGNDCDVSVYDKYDLIESNGDFRSDECIEILKESDIVVTNPPFSCYSSDTEVMTNNGWKLIKDVDISTDLIMSLNPNTHEIEFVRAVDFIKSPVNGELYHYHSLNMDFCVTGNHNMYAYYKDCHGVHKSIPFVEASSVKKSYILPLTGFSWSGNDQKYFVLPETKQLEQYTRKEITVPDKMIQMEDWLEFFGFYIADGCYRDHINSFGKRDYTISIKQNVSNEDYVIDLIRRIGFDASISAGSSDHNRNYNIYSKQLWEYLMQFGRSRDKYIPREFLDLDVKYLKALYKGYTNGDSSLCADGHIQFSTVSEKLISNIQELILKIFGRITQVRKFVRKHSYDDNYGVCYSINVKLNKNKDRFSKYGTPEMITYNDNVYCLTLEKNHIMLVRHNSIIGWCGNCFRDYVAQLMKYEKKFLIIGNMNALTYKEIFPLFRDNRLWYGASIHSGDRKFYVPDDYPLEAAGCGIDEEGRRFIRVKGVRWYTNLDYPARHEKLTLWKTYTPEEYPKYDNYDAINVNKYSEIPVDYDGVMGVPITFIDKFNPEQFEIIGADFDLAEPIKLDNGKIGTGRFYVKKERLYSRIVIRRKKSSAF
jgi:hypothetical protein